MKWSFTAVVVIIQGHLLKKKLQPTTNSVTLTAVASNSTHVTLTAWASYSKRWRKQRHAQYASARTLCVVTMVTVTRLVWFDSARTLRVVVVARSHDGRCRLWLGSDIRAQQEVQLAPRNHLSISAAPRILVIKWLPH